MNQFNALKDFFFLLFSPVHVIFSCNLATVAQEVEWIGGLNPILSQSVCIVYLVEALKMN